jgi:hypothetical protein
MFKDLINPTHINVLVGKLGDALIKALDKPLGYAINWEEYGLCGPYILKLPVAV